MGQSKIDALIQVFKRHGSRAPTMDDIKQFAAFAQASLSNSFGSGREDEVGISVADIALLSDGDFTGYAGYDVFVVITVNRECDQAVCDKLKSLARLRLGEGQKGKLFLQSAAGSVDL